MTNLLFVEDNASARQAAVQALTRAGYQVTACASLNEALDALDDGKFDAILSDYDLGNGTKQKTGLTLWQATNELRLKQPFIGSSTEMDGWNELKEVVNPPNLHLFPKTEDGQWNIPAILAKLAELGL